MAGNAVGAVKTSARRFGVTTEEYLRRRAAGEKHCWRCSEWHPVAQFKRDSSRPDGLVSSCSRSTNADARASYTPKPPRPPPGPRVPTRDGDREQARRRINYLVEQGRIPRPSDLECMDCGDMLLTNGGRHEYDHARGYDGDNQFYVEAGLPGMS